MDDKPMEIPFVLKPGEPFEFEAPSCVELRQVDAADDAEFLDDEDNWTTDITAAWELESEIPEDQRREYVTCLGEIIMHDNPIGARADSIYWSFAHATPEQRCRAYLAWRESQQQAAQP
jgi:hypothetical protein